MNHDPSANHDDGRAPPRGPDEPARIGLGDDERLGRESVALVLRDAGYRVEVFDGAGRLLERAAEAGFDLVLLDIVMPKMSGLEACRLLKGTTQASGLFVPVVLLSGRGDAKARSDAHRMGADHFFTKPYDPQELLSCIAALLRIKRQYDEVSAHRDRLSRMSVFDDQTEAYNTRFTRARLTEEFHRAERSYDPLAYLLVDIDGLGAINDQLGRVVGDRLLRAVARTLRDTVRDVDVVGRVGGDEFAVLLPATHFAGAVAAAERIVRAVPGALDLGPGRASSVSVGVGLYPSRDVRGKDALARAAEEALRHAKREGGGRACVLHQPGIVYLPSSPPPQPAPRGTRSP